MATTTPPLWRWSSVGRAEMEARTVRPRAATDPEAPAGMPKGQGRRREEGGIGTAMRSNTSMLDG